MITSSRSSRGASAPSVWSTTAAGTMIHTVRGRASAWTNAASDAAPVAPSRASACTAGAETS